MWSRYRILNPEQSLPVTFSLTHLLPLFPRANNYLVNSLPCPLPSTPFASFTLPFYSLLLSYSSGLLLFFFFIRVNKSLI